jgi:hypothetical protein
VAPRRPLGSLEVRDGRAPKRAGRDFSRQPRRRPEAQLETTARRREEQCWTALVRCRSLPLWTKRSGRPARGARTCWLLLSNGCGRLAHRQLALALGRRPLGFDGPTLTPAPPGRSRRQCTIGSHARGTSEPGVGRGAGPCRGRGLVIGSCDVAWWPGRAAATARASRRLRGKRQPCSRASALMRSASKSVVGSTDLACKKKFSMPAGANTSTRRR